MSESPNKKFRISTPALRKIKIQVEKSRATEIRLLKEISRPKILIERIPNSVRSAKYYLEQARKRFIKLKDSRSTKSIHQQDSKLNSNSSRSRMSPTKTPTVFIEENTELSSFIPDWLLSRPDFKTAVKAMEIEEKERIPYILKTHPYNRSPEDKKLIKNYLCSINFFKEFSADLISEIGSKLQTQEFDQNQKVIIKGDIPDCMFIIYKGSLSIYLDDIRIAIKKEGEVIGEIALDSRTPRSADVVSDTHSILLKLLKEDYEFIVSNIKRKEKDQNIDLLKKNPFFENWSRLKLIRINLLMNYKSYSRDSVIYQRDSPSNLLYFIKDGTVDIMAYVPMEHHNKWPVSINKWRIHQVNREYLVTIASLSTGQYFGELELKENSKRTLKAVAKTQVSCLTLNKDHFFDNFSPSEIDLLVLLNFIKLPSLKELQEKVINDMNSRISSQKALLDALKLNANRVEGRELLSDSKSKKLGLWLAGYKKRKTNSLESFKHKIVSENSRDISIAKSKNNNKLNIYT
jgi:CRP-like cAMP-binding protein